MHGLKLAVCPCYSRSRLLRDSGREKARFDSAWPPFTLSCRERTLFCWFLAKRARRIFHIAASLRLATLVRTAVMAVKKQHKFKLDNCLASFMSSVKKTWMRALPSLTGGKWKLFVAVQMQLSLQRQGFKAVDKKLPAESGNVFLEKVQQKEFAEDDGSISHNCVELEIQAQAQALQNVKCICEVTRLWVLLVFLYATVILQSLSSTLMYVLNIQCAEHFLPLKRNNFIPRSETFVFNPRMWLWLCSDHLQGRPLDGVQQQSGPGGHGRVDVLHGGQKAAESVGQGVLQQMVFCHRTDVQEATQHGNLLRWEEIYEWKRIPIRNAEHTRWIQRKWVA